MSVALLRRSIALYASGKLEKYLALLRALFTNSNNEYLVVPFQITSFHLRQSTEAVKNLGQKEDLTEI